MASYAIAGSIVRVISIASRKLSIFFIFVHLVHFVWNSCHPYNAGGESFLPDFGKRFAIYIYSRKAASPFGEAANVHLVVQILGHHVTGLPIVLDL